MPYQERWLLLTTSSNYASKHLRPYFASLVASLTKLLMPTQVSCLLESCKRVTKINDAVGELFLYCWYQRSASMTFSYVQQRILFVKRVIQVTG
jgi:hypothetical protein